MKFKDFTGTTQTAQGHKTEGVKWNNAAQCYIGRVFDPLRGEMRSAIWKKSGKHATRPELNLA